MRLLYFSPVFAASYAQRPHFMVEHWLGRGVESVLWVNPYWRRPLWRSHLRRVSRSRDQGTKIDPRISVLSVAPLPTEPLPGGSWLTRRLVWPAAWHRLRQFAQQGPGPLVVGIGRPGVLALAALREFRPAMSFYDAMDNFPAFHRGLSRRAMQRDENAIVSRVDRIVTSSTFLFERLARPGRSVEMLLNAYAMQSLPAWRPVTQKPLVFGYLGCLGAWFDWPLVARLAAALPEARFELVGPCEASPPSALPSNIHFYPPCSQSNAAQHLERFSVGLIPFLNNKLTMAVDPVKFYEYRACGLPVLSTSFGEMAARGATEGVYFLDRGRDLRDVALRALAHLTSAGEVARFRLEHDWQRRFAQASLFDSIIVRSRAA